MGIKTTLVYPSPTRHTSPPLGIAYIAALMRREGYEITLIDANAAKDKEDLINQIKRSHPNLVGFSVQTNYADFSFELASDVKKELPHVLVAFGGPHPTVMPDDTIKRSYIDLVAIGEAEYTVLDLIETLEKGGSLSKVKGLWYKEKGKVHRNPPREFIQNLDELPFPARDMLPMDIYLKNIPPPPMIMPFTHLMANRGCPFNCKYCQPTSHKLFGRKLRYRSPQNVADEMEFLIDKYKLNCINIGGDTLTVNKSWVREFCNEIKSRKIDIDWMCASRVDTVDYNTLSMLKNAGCYLIIFGPESGSQEILNSLGKGITIKQVKDCFRWCNDLGIIASANFMVGNPGETLETMQETIGLIKELKIDYLNIYITNPLPGTQLFDYASEKKLIRAKSFKDLSRHNLGSLKLENVTDEEVKKYRQKALDEYLKLRLSYIYNPVLFSKKLYLHKAFFKRLFSLRHANFLKAVEKSYIDLHTPETRFWPRVKEMLIKSM